MKVTATSVCAEGHIICPRCGGHQISPQLVSIGFGEMRGNKSWFIPIDMSHEKMTEASPPSPAELVNDGWVCTTTFSCLRCLNIFSFGCGGSATGEAVYFLEYSDHDQDDKETHQK